LIIDWNVSHIILANRKASSVFGYESEELNGLNLIDAFVSEEREKTIEDFAASFAADNTSVEGYMTGRSREKRLLRWKTARY
jgi:PAS domain S-box-containing protein